MNRKSIYYFALFFFFLSGTIIPNAALGQSSTNLLDKMNQRLALDIPAPYSDRLRDFVSNSKTLNFNISAEYTESFIIKQMATDQGILKSNQYLFIWNEIYRVLTNDELYDGKDGDEKRLEEYETAFDFVLSCEKEYKENLKEVLEREQQKAKDDARKAKEDAQKAKDDAQKAKDDARKAKEDAQKAKDDAQKAKDDAQKAKEDAQKAKDDTQKAKDDVIKTNKTTLEELANYYWDYKRDPSSALEEEVQHIREIAKHLVDSCKKYDIDYRNHLLQYMKDEKEVEALIKFYGIE